MCFNWAGSGLDPNFHVGGAHKFSPRLNDEPGCLVACCLRSDLNARMMGSWYENTMYHIIYVFIHISI